MKVSFVNKVKFHIKKLYRKAKLPGDDSSQKMPSCTCLKASYTLEAAVIFPLVAGFFVFILFFFRVVQVESQVKAALYYSSRMSALASSANDSSVVSVATAEVLFRSQISDSKHIDTYVSGGKYGVSLLGSKMDGDDVALKAKYKVKLPVSFFAVDGIWKRIIVTAENGQAKIPVKRRTHMYFTLTMAVFITCPSNAITWI